MPKGPVDALGYRAKIGVIVPATNAIVQPECEALRPVGVTNHIARMPKTIRPNNDMEAYRAMLGHTTGCKAALDFLLPVAPDGIVLGHSVDTFVRGMNGALAFEADVNAYAGQRVFIPSLSMVEALNTLGLGKNARLAILTPYFPPGDEAVEEFFTSAGFNVVRLKGMKCQTPLHIAAVTEKELRQEIAEIDGPDIDAVIKVGTNMAMIGFMAAEEHARNKPVLAITATTYWQCLRALGIEDRMNGYGKLFSHH